MERYKTFLQMLKSQNPNSTVFEYQKENQRKKISFGELVDEIEKYKLPSEKSVGFFIDTSIESLVVFFALAGKRRMVLLNPEDSEDELLKQIKSTDVSVLLGAVPESLLCFKKSSDEQQDNFENDILFFTSGTTESSKAVILTEQSLCSSTYNGSSMLKLSSTDKMLCVLPLSHVFGLVCSLLWPLYFGATVCLGNGLSNIFSDFNLYKPTVVCLVPQMAKFLASNKLFNEELKLILIGAGVCDTQTLDLIKKMGIFLSYGYGLTETSSGVALSVGDNPHLMSICPDYDVKIAEDGEILLKSTTTLMKGYYKDAVSTKKAFKDGYFCTGDFGLLKDNLLQVSGRKKDVFVFSDGSKIFIPEYEQKLAEFLGEGADFAVTQQDNGTLILYVYGSEDISPKLDMFNQLHTRSHRISSVVHTKTHLLRTATGKVKRYDLSSLI